MLVSILSTSYLAVRGEEVVVIAVEEIAQAADFLNEELATLHLVFVRLATDPKIISNLLICHIPSGLLRF